MLLPDHRAYQAERGGTLGRRSGPPARGRDRYDHRPGSAPCPSIEHIRTGKLRGLVATTATRPEALPDMRLERGLRLCAANIRSSLQLPNATGDCVSVDFGRRHRGRDREAGLSTKYFSPCFSVCFLDLILSDPHSDLMFDEPGRTA